MESIEQKIDLLTGEKFIPKRINQRFASPINRIRFHNRQAKKIRLDKSHVDKPLHDNYFVLSRLLGRKSEAVFHPEYLKGKGVNLSYHTHVEEYDNKPRNAIYRFIIVVIGPDKIKIVQKDATK
jgi:hypothetical protein